MLHGSCEASDLLDVVGCRQQHCSHFTGLFRAHGVLQAQRSCVMFNANKADKVASTISGICGYRKSITIDEVKNFAKFLIGYGVGCCGGHWAAFLTGKR